MGFAIAREGVVIQTPAARHFRTEPECVQATIFVIGDDSPSEAATKKVAQIFKSPRATIGPQSIADVRQRNGMIDDETELLRVALSILNPCSLSHFHQHLRAIGHPVEMRQDITQLPGTRLVELNCSTAPISTPGYKRLTAFKAPPWIKYVTNIERSITAPESEKHVFKLTVRKDLQRRNTRHE